MRHEVASSTGDTAGVTTDIGEDPTVGLTRSLSRTSLYEAFPFLCTMCGQDIVCEDCGEESAPGYMLETMDDQTVYTDAEEEEDKHYSKE